MCTHTFAVERICRMAGGAQSQLLRCVDGALYVVKFQNNPQGRRILVNELLGALLARRIGLPVAEPAIVEVSEDLIRSSEDMVIQLERGRVPLAPGMCFGSRHPHLPREQSTNPLIRVYDMLPEEHLGMVENLSDFAGMFVFDMWAMNADNRQVVFFRPGLDPFYKALMVDNGFCFNGPLWTFPRRRRAYPYQRPSVYAQVEGFRSFQPWIDRIESKIDRGITALEAKKIPGAWYDGEVSSLHRLLDQLEYRRRSLRQIVWRGYEVARRLGFFPTPILKADCRVALPPSRLARLVSRLRVESE